MTVILSVHRMCLFGNMGFIYEQAVCQDNDRGSQRIALYACLNVCRTLSTKAMQVLLGLPPWDLVALGHRRKH